MDGDRAIIVRPRTGRLTPADVRALAVLVLAVAAGVALVLVATAWFIQMVR